jgi:hypothetical protein
MNAEEFDAFCNEQDKEIAEVNRRHNGFRADLNKKIISIALKDCPELKGIKSRLDPLKEELDDLIISMDEMLESFLCPSGREKSFKKHHVPERSEFKSINEYVEDILKVTSLPHDKEFIEELTELAKFEIEKNNFLHDCHDKVRETVVLHFPEIVNLSGDEIREINFTSYVTMGLFTHAYFFLISESYE